MLDRDLKMQALTLALHLPDDEDTARRVHAYLGELIDNWLFSEGAGKLSKLPSGQAFTLDASLSADAKNIGKAVELP